MKIRLMLMLATLCMAYLAPALTKSYSASTAPVTGSFNLDEYGPDGWVAMAFQCFNSGTSAWEWVQDSSGPTNVRPAAFATAAESKIAFSHDVLIGGKEVNWKAYSIGSSPTAGWSWGDAPYIHADSVNPANPGNSVVKMRPTVKVLNQ